MSRWSDEHGPTAAWVVVGIIVGGVSLYLLVQYLCTFRGYP